MNVAQKFQQDSSRRAARRYFKDRPRATQTLYNYVLLRPWRLDLGLNRGDVSGKLLGLRSRKIEFGGSRVKLVQELPYYIKVQVSEGHVLLRARTAALDG